MHGGAADRSGLIHVGDEIQEVNGISVDGKTPNDVLKILVIQDFIFNFLHNINKWKLDPLTKKNVFSAKFRGNDYVQNRTSG